MERIAIASVLLAVAVATAAAVRRRQPDPPTQARWTVPAQLDRADFDHPDRPWLVLVFTSATCESCARATAKAEVLASQEVAYQEVSWQEQPDLHRKYGVEVAPAIVFADWEGVVRASFVGPPSATDLWAAVADVRDRAG